MNKRIKQLADKIWAEEYWTNPNTDKLLPAQLNKFAELIVQECTQLLFAESERLYSYSSECDDLCDSDEAELCAEKCMDNIKIIEEHFGVEE